MPDSVGPRSWLTDVSEQLGLQQLQPLIDSAEEARQKALSVVPPMPSFAASIPSLEALTGPTQAPQDTDRTPTGHPADISQPSSWAGSLASAIPALSSLTGQTETTTLHDENPGGAPPTPGEPGGPPLATTYPTYQPPTANAQPAPSSAGAGPIDNSSRAAFARTAYPYALKAAGGDPELAKRFLASAISENGTVGAGGSIGVGFNFGGIKYDPEAIGSGTYGTWESEGGQRVNQNAGFAHYPDIQAGFDALPRFMQKNMPKAWAAYQQSHDAAQLYRDINAAGYATDQNWHNAIESIAARDIAPALTSLPVAPAAQPMSRPQTSSGPENGPKPAPQRTIVPVEQAAGWADTPRPAEAPWTEQQRPPSDATMEQPLRPPYPSQVGAAVSGDQMSYRMPLQGDSQWIDNPATPAPSVVEGASASTSTSIQNQSTSSPGAQSDASTGTQSGQPMMYRQPLQPTPGDAVDTEDASTSPGASGAPPWEQTGSSASGAGAFQDDYSQNGQVSPWDQSDSQQTPPLNSQAPMTTGANVSASTSQMSQPSSSTVGADTAIPTTVPAAQVQPNEDATSYPRPEYVPPASPLVTAPDPNAGLTPPPSPYDAGQQASMEPAANRFSAPDESPLKPLYDLGGQIIGYVRAGAEAADRSLNAPVAPAGSPQARALQTVGIDPSMVRNPIAAVESTVRDLPGRLPQVPQINRKAVDEAAQEIIQSARATGQAINEDDVWGTIWHGAMTGLNTVNAGVNVLGADINALAPEMGAGPVGPGDILANVNLPEDVLHMAQGAGRMIAAGRRVTPEILASLRSNLAGNAERVAALDAERAGGAAAPAYGTLGFSPAEQDMRDLTRPRVVPEQYAREIPMDTRLPSTPEFEQAVANTPGADITPDGLRIGLERWQVPDQAMEEAGRTGVFYLPEGSPDLRHYRNNTTRKSPTGYGGEDRITGTTLIKAPIVVKGATGGKAPEAAYDLIKGKGAYDAMRRDVLNATYRPYGGRMSQQDVAGRVASVIDKYGGDSSLADEIVRTATTGNQLPYAVQEHIVAAAVREAGYDAVVGWTKRKGAPAISEVFDVRESRFPSPEGDFEVHSQYRPQQPPRSTTTYGTLGAVPSAEAPHTYSPTAPEGYNRMYHGTASDFPSVDPEKLDPNGLYGPGYYTTSDPRVAGSYSTSRDPLAAQRGRVQRLREDAMWAGLHQQPGEVARLTQEADALEASMANTPGPNVRPLDVPNDLNLLDADAPLTPDVIGRVRSVVAKATPEVRQELSVTLDNAARMLQEGQQPTVDALLTGMLGDAERVTRQMNGSADRGLFAEIMQRAGFDGIQHTGGQRVPMMDAAGRPIEHNVNVIFPGAVGKVRNAFSGTYGGATTGFAPSSGGPGLGTRIAGEAGNAIAGGMAGATYAQATGDSEDPGALARDVGIGALGAIGLRHGYGALNRGRGAEGALATLGAVPPEGARPPRTGNLTQAFGEKPGERVQFRFRVVPMEDLVTSHTNALGINPSFPSELQPRVRERAASRAQIERIMKEFDPEQMLVDTHTVDRGPMIVGPDNVVESGNGRSIALRRLAEEHPAEYQRYVDELRGSLGDYGLADADLRGIRNPVLVRERVTDLNRAEFAASANVSAAAEMAPIERAFQDAGRLSDEHVANLTVGEGQSIDQALLSPTNIDTVRAFVSAVPDAERGALLDAQGNLNAYGLERLKSALLVKTYTGEAGTRIATAFVESTDPGVRNVESAIYASLPSVARYEAMIGAGERDAGLSIAPDVAAAVDVYARLRRAGMSVPDYLAQAPLFGERETNAVQDQILQYINDNARSSRRIRDMLEGYANAVDNQADAAQVGMFGEASRATKEEVLNGVTRELGTAPADAGTDLGAVGAGGQELAGANQGPAAAPESSVGAQASSSGDTALPDAEASRRRFERAQAAPVGHVERTPASEIIPRGGPEGRLAQEGAPEPLAAPSSVAPVGPNAAPVGGPTGTLAQPGAPRPVVPQGAGTLLPVRDFGSTRDVVDHVLREEQQQARALSIRAANESRTAEQAGQVVMPGTRDHPGVVQQIREVVAPWSRRLDIVRYAGMLSDSAAHIINAGGGALSQAADVAVTPIAAALDVGRSAVTRQPRQVFFSEVPARIAGQRAGGWIGLQNGAEILRTGISPADAAKQMERESAGFGTNIPGLAPEGSRRAGAVDFAFEAPLRSLAAADAVFRTMAQGGHLAAEAEAAAKMANGGKAVTPEMLRAAMNDPKVIERANYLSARSVLQEDRAATTWLKNTLRSAPPGVKELVQVEIPFTKTPYNVVAQGVGMTPAGLIGVVQDMQNHKPAREIEYRVARVALGTAIGAAAFSSHAAGNLTGPRPTDAKELSTLPPGWQPWSYKAQVGGQTYYVPLSVLGPFALPPVAAILAGESVKKGKGAFTLDNAAGIALGLGQYAAQNTFFQAVSNIGGLLDQRDAGKNIERNIEQVVSQYSPHILGGGGLGRELQRIMGMPQRDPQTALEALMATSPVTADQVAPRQDVLGRPSVPQMSGPLAAVARVGREQDAGVIRAYRKAGEGLPMAAPVQIRDSSTDTNRTLTEAQRHRWRRVYGAALREGWANEGNPQDIETLRKVKNDASQAANETILGLR